MTFDSNTFTMDGYVRLEFICISFSLKKNERKFIQNKSLYYLSYALKCVRKCYRSFFMRWKLHLIVFESVGKNENEIAIDNLIWIHFLSMSCSLIWTLFQKFKCFYHALSLWFKLIFQLLQSWNWYRAETPFLFLILLIFKV